MEKLRMFLKIFNKEALIMSILLHLQRTHCFAGFLQASHQRQALTGHLKWKFKMDTSYLNNLTPSNLHAAFSAQRALSTVREILCVSFSTSVELGMQEQ